MYNRIIIMGRLANDPELRQTQSGVAMCKISVAVDRGFAKQGEEKKADFFNVVFWRQQAEFVSRYFSKGRMIHVEGRLQNDNYTDQDGQKHYSTSIQADNIAFCGDKSHNAHTAAQPAHSGVYSTNPQNYTPTANAPENAVKMQNEVQLGDLSEFEEILSDNAPPF